MLKREMRPADIIEEIKLLSRGMYMGSKSSYKDKKIICLCYVFSFNLLH
jgi:hypothetical protein